jgi:hypothetical protein
VQFSGVPTSAPLRDPVLPHRTRDTRRLGLEQESRRQHQPVEGQLTGVVRDHQHATRGHPVDVVGADPEVVAVEEHAGQRHLAHPARIEAVAVEAVLVQLVGHLAEPGAQVVLGLARRQRDQGAGEVRECRADAPFGHR